MSDTKHTCGIDGDPGAVTPLDGHCDACSNEEKQERLAELAEQNTDPTLLLIAALKAAETKDEIIKPIEASVQESVIEDIPKGDPSPEEIAAQAELAKFMEARQQAKAKREAAEASGETVKGKVKGKLVKSVRKMAAFGETTKTETVEREIITPEIAKSDEFNETSKGHSHIKERLDNDLIDPRYIGAATGGIKKELTTEEKEAATKLRDELAGLWSVGARKDHLSELDQYIDGVDTGDAGAKRNNDGSGTGVRISFKQPKRSKSTDVTPSPKEQRPDNR